MIENQKLPEEFKQELFVEANGEGFMTQSAVGRLLGIAQQNINKLLVNIATPKNLSEPLKPFAGMDLRATPKIPDYVVGAIVIHYAMYARKKTEKAKKLAVVLAGCSIRTLIQRTLGWQPETKPQKPMSSAEMFARQAQINLEHEQRLNEHDVEIDKLGNLYNLVCENINTMNQNRLQVLLSVHESKMLAIEDPSPLPLRKTIWKLVNEYSYAANCPPDEAWTLFYTELRDRYSFDAKARQKNQGLKFKLDAVEQEPEMLENLHKIVSAYVKNLNLPTPRLVYTKNMSSVSIDDCYLISHSEAKSGDAFENGQWYRLKSKQHS